MYPNIYNGEKPGETGHLVQAHNPYPDHRAPGTGKKACMKTNGSTLIMNYDEILLDTDCSCQYVTAQHSGPFTSQVLHMFTDCFFLSPCPLVPGSCR